MEVTSSTGASRGNPESAKGKPEWKLAGRNPDGGGNLGWAFRPILFQVASLVDSWSPPRESGYTSTMTVSLLQFLLKVGDVLFPKNYGATGSAVGWPFLRVLPEAITKQMRADKGV